MNSSHRIFENIFNIFNASLISETEGWTINMENVHQTKIVNNAYQSDEVSQEMIKIRWYIGSLRSFL